jgi:hypothetical protein
MTKSGWFLRDGFQNALVPRKAFKKKSQRYSQKSR